MGLLVEEKHILGLSRALVVSINLHQLSYTVGNKVNWFLNLNVKGAKDKMAWQ